MGMGGGGELGGGKLCSKQQQQYIYCILVYTVAVSQREDQQSPSQLPEEGERKRDGDND